MKKECRETLVGISSYLDGDLDAPSCDAIERHTRECESCAALVNGLRESVGLCRQTTAAQLPADVRERARANIQRLLGG